MMRALRNFFTIACAASALSCGGGGNDSGTAAVTFAFRIHGLTGSEEFRVRTASPLFIAQAREQLRLPEAQRHLFPAGPIAPGNGGYNLDWGWHFTDATLSETSIELCDGRPSMVEADLAYWLGIVKSFCPWGGFLYAELT